MTHGTADAVRLFRPEGPFFLIAGPCVLEDDDLNLAIARHLAELADDLSLPIIFKASFDKANRGRRDAPRGPGLEQGLPRLERVRRESGLPVLTDVHETGQAASAAQVCDALQIPAFLCRQTDLIEAAAATGRPVNIKKGQWMAPEEMAGAVEKARAAGAPAGGAGRRGPPGGVGGRGGGGRGPAGPPRGAPPPAGPPGRLHAGTPFGHSVSEARAPGDERRLRRPSRTSPGGAQHR
jgi:3-deoxy-D-manno-octulosonic acid (KDO) 8-phosphate synthase